MSLIDRMRKLERRRPEASLPPLIVRGEPDPAELAAAHAAGRLVIILERLEPPEETQADDADTAPDD